jgi:tripartite-type tricarboxylate transporter receptor subunit TctC
MFGPNCEMPRPIIDRISKTLVAISREPEFNKILGNLGIGTTSSMPDGLAGAIKSDTALLRAALDAAGLLRKEAAN